MREIRPQRRYSQEFENLDPNNTINKLLELVRIHFDMDVAFVAEIRDGMRIFRNVNSREAEAPIRVGGFDPVDESYCHKILNGVLPELIRDATKLPEACKMPVTEALPVGAHLSVPITLPDGSIYGTFCCFRYAGDETLTDRDLGVMKAFATIAGDILEAQVISKRKQDEIRLRIVQAIERHDFEVCYQPIYRLRNNKIAGYEALTRFGGLEPRSPEVWFNEASEVGLAADLEFSTLVSATGILSHLDEGVSLSVNLSPQAILTQEFKDKIGALPLNKLVLEITEHAAVECYDKLIVALSEFRSRGMRLAVDDAGAGHASFRHVLDLNPDIIKLDKSLTRNLNNDPGRRALAIALCSFGRAIGSEVVAEGVETEDELRILRRIGVTKVQGYLLGRPKPKAEAIRDQSLIPPQLQQAAGILKAS